MLKPFIFELSDGSRNSLGYVRKQQVTNEKRASSLRGGPIVPHIGPTKQSDEASTIVISKMHTTSEPAAQRTTSAFGGT